MARVDARGGVVGCRWSRGVWPLPDPDEEEVSSDDEEWMEVERANFVRCDTNVNCHYINGRVQAREDETVRDIAQRYNLDDTKLALLNKIEHPSITPTSRLVRGTLLLLPVHPSLMQLLPENASVDAAVSQVPLPQLARLTMDVAKCEEETSGHSQTPFDTSLFVRANRRSRMGTRHATRASPLLFGSQAVRAGCSEGLLGARVAVECVNSRFLGTVACYDAATSQYHIILDAHGGPGGLGDYATQALSVATQLPCPDVSVLAAQPRSSTRASSPAERDPSPARSKEKITSSIAHWNGVATTGAANSSPDTPPLLQHAPNHETACASSHVSATQLAPLVGMKVTRGFDGVSGTVSTLVPGSDVIIIEWDDGDCEDMHFADIQRQGLL